MDGFGAEYKERIKRYHPLGSRCTRGKNIADFGNHVEIEKNSGGCPGESPSSDHYERTENDRAMLRMRSRTCRN